MKTVSIRDLRQKWPAVERGLKTSGGMLVTRDSMPVARLLPLDDSSAIERERFSPQEHSRWLMKTWGSATPAAWVDAALDSDRNDV